MSDVEFLSEPYAAPPPRRPQRARWLVPVVAAAVVAGGGVGTYYALSSSSAGSDTPVAAVQAMVADMEHSDLIGLLDDMAPGERTALEPGLKSDVDNLKRLGVLAGDADPSSVRGVTISGANLKYSAGTRVNSNVQIVDVNGGTLRLHGDLSKLPLSARILKMVGSSQKTSTQTVNLAEHPMHIAAQQVGGRWYWSLFYTYAHSAVPGVPGSSITPHGADSPTAAVKQMISKLAANDWRAAIALLSPAELSAVQTYAGAALRGAPRRGTGGYKLDALQLQESSAADGYRQVTFKSLTIRGSDGKVSITRTGDCYRVVTNGKSQHFCANQLPRLLQRMFGGVDCAVSGTALAIPGSGATEDFGYYSSRPRRGGMSAPGCHRSGFRLTPAQRTALTHLVQGLLAVGVDTQEVDGSWYVAPVRTASDSIDSVLSHLQGNDLWALTSLGR
jgi:hypothetical protein